jgi:hypothetical protein
MQRIDNDIPETNYVSTVKNVAAIMWLKCTVYAVLFPMLNDCVVTLVHPAVCVQCPIWLLH